VKETRIFQILTETDSPFLGPVKGERNEPVNVIETIKMISKLRNIPEEDVANIIYNNTRKLFGIL
jgi:TatD DNase family protein